MTPLELGLLLVVAAVCGALGQAIAGNPRGGCLVTTAVGFIGALLGSWLSRTLKLPEVFVIQIDRMSFPIVWSIVGGALFVAVLSLFTRRHSRE